MPDNPKPKGRDRILVQSQRTRNKTKVLNPDAMSGNPKQKEGIETRHDAGEPEIKKEGIELRSKAREPETKLRD